jgi:hypothetical protein
MEQKINLQPLWSKGNLLQHLSFCCYYCQNFPPKFNLIKTSKRGKAIVATSKLHQNQEKNGMVQNGNLLEPNVYIGRFQTFLSS